MTVERPLPAASLQIDGVGAFSVSATGSEFLTIAAAWAASSL
jgi:hypothetical protein